MLGGALGNDMLGGGVRLDASQTQWSQGQLQTTGNPLDLAIQGGGLFEVSGSNNGGPGNYYTRDGEFQMDHSGYLTNQDGLRVQGYTIDAQRHPIGRGRRSRARHDAEPGRPDVERALTLNLNSNDTPPTTTPFESDNSATYNYQTSFTAYDWLGNAHTVQEFFVNNGNGSWTANAMVDGGDVTGGTKGVLTSIGSTQLQFNTDGSPQSQTGSLTASFLNATPNQAIATSFGDDIASGGTGLAGTTHFGRPTPSTAPTSTAARRAT